MKLKVDLTEPEINSIEELAVCWTLCPEHKKESLTEVECFKATQDCLKCVKINKALRLKALHAWSKLAHAYNLARTGKCC